MPYNTNDITVCSYIQLSELINALYPSNPQHINDDAYTFIFVNVFVASQVAIISFEFICLIYFTL